MSDILRLLKEIQDELREIKLLYKELVEKLIPVEEPLEDEKEAIEVSDEVVSEEEMIKSLKSDTSD
jgi:archaellum component FlaC